MVLIFSASADKASYQHSSTLFVPLIHWLFPRLSSQQVEFLHHFLRKCAHFTEYAILALLIRRALINVFPATFARWDWRMAGTVIALVFLYASSDEFHQSFVPGRTALFSDVLIDTTGGSAGLMLAWLAHRLWKKRPA
jgi:VanZ family protein